MSDEIGLILAAILSFGCLIWMFINLVLKQEEPMRDAEEKAEEYRKRRR